MNIFRRIARNLIVFFFIIILILFIVFLLPTNRLLRKIYVAKSNYKIDKYPENSYFLFMDYEGSIDNTPIYRAVHNIAYEEIPNYYNKLKELTDDELIKYYRFHNYRIYKILGINSADDFVKFAKSVQALHSEKLVLERYIINDNITLEKKDGFFRVVLLIKYEKNDFIGLILKIPEEKIGFLKTPVSIDANVSEDNLKYIETIDEHEVYENDVGKSQE